MPSPEAGACADQKDVCMFVMGLLQVTFDDCGVYVSTGTFCGDEGMILEGTSMWAYPKGEQCTPMSPEGCRF